MYLLQLLLWRRFLVLSWSAFLEVYGQIMELIWIIINLGGIVWFIFGSVCNPVGSCKCAVTIQERFQQRFSIRDVRRHLCPKLAYNLYQFKEAKAHGPASTQRHLFAKSARSRNQPAVYRGISGIHTARDVPGAAISQQWRRELAALPQFLGPLY